MSDVSTLLMQVILAVRRGLVANCRGTAASTDKKEETAAAAVVVYTSLVVLRETAFDSCEAAAAAEVVYTSAEFWEVATTSESSETGAAADCKATAAGGDKCTLTAALAGHFGGANSA